MDGARESRLRAVDLAATVGISVQQVRNYVESGVLPPAGRTASGYRIFTTEHARALDRGAAIGRGARLESYPGDHVGGARGDLPAALAALDGGHAELDRERAEIRRVLGAFETVLASPPAARPAPRRAARIGEVAALVGVRTSQLRLWEQRGLLRPRRTPGTNYRVYDEAELRAAQVIALLRRGAYPFEIIEAVLGELRTTGERPAGPRRAGPPRAGAARAQPAPAAGQRRAVRLPARSRGGGPSLTRQPVPPGDLVD